MPNRSLTFLRLGFALLVTTSFLRAETPATQTHPAPTTNTSDQGPQDKLSVTEGEVNVGGKALRYRATAGTIVMKDEFGKAKAEFFFVAYEKRPADTDLSKRPVTFVFNGGPGAASVWLHLGTAGPRRLKLDEAGAAPAPPFALVDNPFTWLDATDLVFIDPVGTGYSRPAPGEKAEQFYGVEEDIGSVADFIRLYTTRWQRWPSPKFLAGESYGTTRAAGLSEFLLDRYGVALNGIILVSSVLDFQTLSFAEGNELPYELYLPTYAAVAWYHKKLPAELQADLGKTLAEVERWSLGEYAAALAKGARLGDDERRDVAQKLARYTGLPAPVIEKARLRVDPSVFRKTLLEDSRKLLGRFDARLTGYDPEPLSKNPGYDPSLSPFLAAYSSTMNDYVRRSLKFESDLPYEVLSGRLQPWNLGQSGGGFLSVADNLRNAMLKNPHLRVLFASAYFDLATPYLATRYTVDHMDLGPELRKNLTQTHYEGGHMLYHYQKSAEKLHEDIATFIEKSTAEDAGPGAVERTPEKSSPRK